MILVDVNLLIYAHYVGSQFHDATRLWWESVLAKPEPIALGWTSILGFLRITTSPRALASPLLLSEAIAIIEDLLQRPQVCILQPGERHWSILQRMLMAGQATGNLASDAHLAALAIEHGALL
ncbi:MAG: TA system VapC family ribonuclease toxin, partial [Terriglobales bacterium]